ncbi:MAG TPA: zf-HC2 domain-containing protein [Verrucomicrobiae bacterium]|nr:zf-HC2 domain-containing protein [Verrucomicrobiae bacterium]
MNCRQVVELMTEYIEGTLSIDERTRFEEHIAGCDGCRAYLAQMRTARQLTRRLADEPIPPTLERELLDAFRNWRRV